MVVAVWVACWSAASRMSMIVMVVPFAWPTADPSEATWNAASPGQPHRAVAAADDRWITAVQPDRHLCDRQTVGDAHRVGARQQVGELEVATGPGRDGGQGDRSPIEVGPRQLNVDPGNAEFAVVL